jgi:hypothetical protein
VLEAVPLNILRIQRALHSLPPQLLADLGRLNALRAQEGGGGGACRRRRASAGGAGKQRQGRALGQQEE